jgi:hypothetical protein
MAFWAAAGAILGLGQGILGGMQQQQAAQEANELAEQMAKKQYRRAMKEWRIDWWQQKSNWLWQTAQTEAMRFAERQKESDHNWRSQKLIESAMENLAVNTGAIRDKFITEEKLRATQVGMEYGYKMDQLAATAGETVRQYMAGIRDTALQSTQLVNQTEREGQALVSSLVFEQQKDQLQWEMGQIAAVIDGAQVAATASARTGGSGTADRLAVNVAQKLGQAWGQMQLQSQDRQARLGLMNTAMRGETAVQLGRMALQMQDQSEKIRYTNSRYAADTAYETGVFRDLTIPSFALAGRQGAREMKSLQIQTQGIINEASMPYRKAIIFDPIKPIKGLRPEYMAPTKVYEPSTAGIIGNSILGGVQGAINMGTYQKADGTLGWR